MEPASSNGDRISRLLFSRIKYENNKSSVSETSKLDLNRTRKMFAKIRKT